MRPLTQVIAAVALGVVATSAIHAQDRAVVTEDSIATALRALNLIEGSLSIQGQFERGDQTIAANDTVRGPLVVVAGNADIHGTVLGNVVAVFGDVTVRDGGDVHGNATAWRGRVIVEGGRVRGAMTARPSPAARRAATPLTTGEALKLAGGWTAVVLIVGLLALVLAARNIDATSRVLEHDFGRAFFAGVAGQLGFLPLLLLVVTALTVTLIGVLLVPFALAAAPVAFVGLLTLGWLASALMLGRVVMSAQPGTDRAAMVRALVPGLAILMAPWLLAAALQEAGSAAIVARAVAGGVTWVAASAGLGAALLSRAGTSSGRIRAEVAPAASAGWQTPTPVAGVAAARRPVPARPEPSAK